MKTSPKSDLPSISSFGTLSRVAAGITICVGSLVLLGWILDVGVLKSISPTWISMKSNTAASLVLAGCALLLHVSTSTSLLKSRIADACAVVVILSGLLTLGEYLTGLDLGIDHVIIPEQAGTIATTYPGRMALTTAAGFSLLGAALWLFRRRSGWLVQSLVLVVSCLALVGITGYTYNLESLQRIGPQSLAIHTAISFLVLSLGMLLGQPPAGLMRLMSDTGPGGLVLRRLLPTILLVPFLLGWAILFGSQRGLYGTGTGWALFSVATVVISTVAVTRNALIIHTTDKALVESNAVLTAILESADMPIFSVDRDFRYINFNRAHAAAMKALYGADIRLGRGILEYQTVAEDRETTRQNLERALRGEMHVATAYSGEPGDSRMFFEVSHNPICGLSGEILGVSVFAHDMTVYMQARETIRTANIDLERRVEERTEQLQAANMELGKALESIRENEARYQQAQKLESLGVLAGGIAHDFNNLLMVILGQSELAAMRIPAESIAQRSLAEIGKATQRGADLCRQMLAYAGKGRFQVAPLDLNMVISGIDDMLQLAVSKKATLRFDLAPALPQIEADVAQIRQILVNLVTNASEAIGKESGFITMVTSVRDCDRAFLDSAWGGENLPEGRYTCLEVTDTGSGMDEATRARIFEPFFTTKFTGRGLGLAAVTGIVRGHGGAIKVSSEPGRGTTFTLLFRPSAVPVLPPSPARDECSERQGRGTVLIVDDEEGVRNVARGMLEEIGYCVLTAGDGIEALEMYRAHRDDIACVLLDLTMPKMDGEETLRQILAINPAAIVILSSGYNEQQTIQQFVGKGLAGFIQKPYQLTTLELKLRQVLGK